MFKDEHNRFDRMFIVITHIAVWQPSAYKSALGDFNKGLNVYAEATLGDDVCDVHIFEQQLWFYTGSHDKYMPSFQFNRDSHTW